MPEYRGPISLNELESRLGDFDRVRLVPAPPGVIELEPGERQLTTLGYIWPCGCETRGSRTPAWAPACAIGLCPKHAAMDFDELPVQEVPEDPPETFVLDRDKATLKPGGIITVKTLSVEDDFES